MTAPFVTLETTCRDQGWSGRPPVFSLPGAPSPAVPGPRRLLRELPVWLTVLVAALLPGRWAGPFESALFPWRAIDGLTVAAAGAAILGRAALGGRERSEEGSSVLAPWLAVLAWAAVSLAWAGLAGEAWAGMVWTLAVSAAAAILGASVWSHGGERACRDRLDRLTIALAAVSLLYALESLVGIGLRDPVRRLVEAGGGWERIRGPLFSASTGSLVLIPALGWVADQVLGAGRRRGRLILSGAAFLVTLAGLGSRAAVLVTALFLLLAWLAHRQRTRAEVLGLTALTLTAALAFFTASRSFERLTLAELNRWQDPSRRATHGMAFRRVTADLLAAIPGAGYGGVWAWYPADVREGEAIASGRNQILTPQGVSLYHSHSLPLLLAVELGLPGVALGGWALWCIGIALSCRGRPRGIFEAAVLASTAAFAFDLYLVKNTAVSLVWWLYLFGALHWSVLRRRAWSC